MNDLRRRDTGPFGQAQYGDPSARIWGLYLSVAEKFDKAHSDSWSGNTDGVLVFVRVHSRHFSYRSCAQLEAWVYLHRPVFSPRRWLLLS